jgi:hypothetical protein
MKITGRDLLATVALVLVIAVLIVVSTIREKVKEVPTDDRHRPFYEALEKGARRAAAEKGCLTCHNTGIAPLPKKHPPKEECLICHRLHSTGR